MESASKRRAKAKGKSFSLSEELILIKEVQSRPILWDSTQDVYKRADLKPEVWSAVAANVGPSFTVEDVQHRFKSMKDTFMTNFRKVAESHRSGAGTDDVYKPKWHLYNQLMFRQKANVQAPSTSNIEIPVNTASCESASPILAQELEATQSSAVQSSLSTSTQYYFDENLQQLVLLPSDSENASNQGGSPSSLASMNLNFSNPSSPDFPPCPESAPNPQARKKRPAANSEEPGLFSKKGFTKKSGSALMEKAVKVMKAISEQPIPSMELPETTPKGREEIFANFVASRLCQIKDEVKKKECENAIMAILMNY